jgi:arabinose-5-phosphate isomerase
MITVNDTILALSNSGETSELSDILAYAKRHGIALIGITSKGASTLDKTADVSFVLPKREEACPLGLAPTTSTTMMIALGDALATAVLKRRGFSATDFSSLHPGGKLGQRLMRVEKLMHKAPKMPLIQRDSSMEEALLQMTSRGFGCVGVLDAAGDLLGMVTDGDLRRHMGPGLMASKVVDIMTKDPRVIHENILTEEALARMNQAGITSFFVVTSDQETDRQPIGILHIHDCLRAGIQ